jgi:hypothetical protein
MISPSCYRFVKLVSIEIITSTLTNAIPTSPILDQRTNDATYQIARCCVEQEQRSRQCVQGPKYGVRYRKGKAKEIPTHRFSLAILVLLDGRGFPYFVIVFGSVKEFALV